VLDQFEEIHEHFVVLDSKHTLDPSQVGLLGLVNKGFILVLLEDVVIVVRGRLLLDNLAEINELSLDLAHEVVLDTLFDGVQSAVGLLQKLVDLDVVVVVVFGVIDVHDLEHPDDLFDLHQFLTLHRFGDEQLVHQRASLLQEHLPAHFVVHGQHDLTQHILLKELDFSDLVEHGALTHPLGQ